MGWGEEGALLGTCSFKLICTRTHPIRVRPHFHTHFHHMLCTRMSTWMEVSVSCFQPLTLHTTTCADLLPTYLNAFFLLH